MTKFQQLKNDIAEMQSVVNDKDTPQSVKDSINPSLKKAQGMLKELEALEQKPAAKTTTATHKPTAKKVVAKPIAKVDKQKVQKITNNIDAILASVKTNPKLKAFYAGTSKSSLRNDAGRQALPPGKHVTKNGTISYERRSNRTDLGNNKLGDGGEVDGTFYKEGSRKYGLGNTEIFIIDNDDSFDVYDNIFDDNYKKWMVTKLETFDTMDAAEEFAINHSKTTMAKGGRLELAKVGKLKDSIPTMDKKEMVEIYEYDDKFIIAVRRDGWSTSFTEKLYNTYDAAYKAAGRKANGLEQGGYIPNNYANKTPQQVWDMWTVAQKIHFLKDHKVYDDIHSFVGKIPMNEITRKYEYNDLPHKLKVEIENHINEGQYAKGGEVSKADRKMFFNYCKEFYGRDGIYNGIFESNFDSRGASDEKINKAIDEYLNDKELTKKFWSGGDSLDREVVRDIMLYGLDAVKQNGVALAKGGNLAKRKSELANTSNNALVVVCKSVGNPDYQQYAAISPTKMIPVNSLKEAAEVCRKYISEWDLGGGNWGDGAGNIFDVNKKIVAHVSYNGRVWKGNSKNWNEKEEITGTELTKSYYTNGGSIPSHFGTGKNIKVFSYQTQNFDSNAQLATAFENAQEHIETEYKESNEKSYILYSNALENFAKKVDEILGIEKQIVEKPNENACNKTVELLQEAGVFNYKSGYQINFVELTNLLMPHIATIQEFAALEENVLYQGGPTKIISRGRAVMAINTETGEVTKKVFLLHDDDSIENAAWNLAYEYNLVEHAVEPKNPQLELGLDGDLYKVQYWEYNDGKREDELRTFDLYAISQDDAEEQFENSMLPKLINEDYEVSEIKKVMASGGGIEIVLYACKIGQPDYKEEIITTDATKIETAKEWAKKNGFNRFRVSSIDMNEKPNFGKTIMAKGGGISKEIDDRYGSSYRGNGITYYDRKKQQHGDYKKVAFISEEGIVKFYENELPAELKNKIEDEAVDIKENGFQHNVFSKGGGVPAKSPFGIEGSVGEFYIADKAKDNRALPTAVVMDYTNHSNLFSTKKDAEKHLMLLLEKMYEAQPAYNLHPNKMGSGGKIEKIVFTKAEDAKFDELMSFYLNNGLSDSKAEKETLKEMVVLFPRLKKPLENGAKIDASAVMAKGDELKEFNAYGKSFLVAKNGVVKKVKDYYKNDTIKEVDVKDKMYKFNPTYKTYNDSENNILLLKDLGNDIDLPFEKGGKVGGRGWEGATKGKKITDIKQFKVGKVYLSYDKQFNAKNLIKITSLDKTGLKRPIVYAEFVRNTGNDHEFAIWDFELKKNEYYEAKESSTFKQKQTAIAKNLVGKPVPKKYQKQAGKKYNSKEAMAAAAKIAGKITAAKKK